MSRYDIAQRFRENSGNVIGVQGDVVNSDVFIHQYQITVVAGDAVARAALASPRFDPAVSPFPGARPFSHREQGVFFGRDVEIGRLVNSLAGHRVTTLFGPAGCGKTSLLQAGLVPAVAFHGGIAVGIDDYENAAVALRTALEEASRDHSIAVVLPDQTSLTTLCESLVGAGGSLVLILDQFERLLDAEPGSREAFLDDIVALRASSLDVRLVVSVSDQAYPRLASLSRVPDLLASSIALDRLTPEQATEAVTRPLLQLDGPVQFATAGIAQLVVADLNDLCDEPRNVESLHLQLVCDNLFGRARDRHAAGGSSVIDGALYASGDAAGIVTAWVNENVTRLFPNDPLVASSVISAVLTHSEGWVTAHDLAAPGVGETAVRDALDRLAGIGLLSKRRIPEASFAFPSRAARGIALQFAGEDARRRLEAGDMLRGKWADWSANRYLVPRGQLRYLASFDPPLQIGLVHGLLLLRSAVSAGEDPRPWLASLAALPDGDLAPLVILETGASPDIDSRLGRLLDLPLDLPPDLPPDLAVGTPRPYGPIARQAVAGGDAVAREVGALALSLVEGYENRLRAALTGEAKLPATRGPELWAALDNAGVDVRAQVNGIERRARSWFTRRRIRDRLRRDERTILVRSGGVAAGAGTGVACYWFVRSWFTSEDWGPAIATGWLWGFILVFALVVCAEVVASATSAPAARDGPGDRPRLGGWREAAATVVAFSLGDLVVAWGNGYHLADWQAWRLLSLGAGAVLWVAYRWPASRPDRRLLVDAALSMVCGAAFGVLQLARIRADDGLLLSVSQAGDYLQAQLRVADPTTLAVVDAVLLGAALGAGMRWGARGAGNVLARWRAIDARTGS